MSDELCPHDGDPHTCPPCQRKAGRVRDDRPTPDYSFTARYDGHCPCCSLPIMVGQRAVKWTDGRVQHEGCVS